MGWGGVGWGGVGWGWGGVGVGWGGVGVGWGGVGWGWGGVGWGGVGWGGVVVGWGGVGWGGGGVGWGGWGGVGWGGVGWGGVGWVGWGGVGWVGVGVGGGGWVFVVKVPFQSLVQREPTLLGRAQITNYTSVGSYVVQLDMGNQPPKVRTPPAPASEELAAHGASKRTWHKQPLLGEEPSNGINQPDIRDPQAPSLAR